MKSIMDDFKFQKWAIAAMVGVVEVATTTVVIAVAITVVVIFVYYNGYIILL